MATYHAMVVTSWAESPGRRDMKVAMDYPACWSDVTGQPDTELVPDPNALVAYGKGLSEAQINALLADETAVVLWYEAET